MNKQPVHIFLDANTYLVAKSQGVNISKLCNDLLSEYLHARQSNDEVLVLEEELLRKRSQVDVLSSEIGRLSVSLVHAREQQVKQLEEKKQAESRLLEEKKRKDFCLSCGSFLKEKRYCFPAGNVCKNCYLTATKKSIARWELLEVVS